MAKYLRCKNQNTPNPGISIFCMNIHAHISKKSRVGGVSVIRCRSNAFLITLVCTIKTIFQGRFGIPKILVVSEIMSADAALKYYHNYRN